MADYRYYSNLATHDAGGATPELLAGLVQCTTNGRYFDRVDSNFLNVLKTYKIGDPIEAEPDPAGKIAVTPLDQLKAGGFVGIYTTIEAIMTPSARQLLGWTDTTLGLPWPGGDDAEA